MCIILIIWKVFKVKYFRFEKQDLNGQLFFSQKTTVFLNLKEFGNA